MQYTPNAKGSYILLIELVNTETIPVGKLGPITFPSGFYAYIGSAMAGLEARISRHLRGNKKYHWHIDYLLDRALIREVITSSSAERTECPLAQALAGVSDSIPLFGSSDCHCRSHLFFQEQYNVLKTKVNEALATVNSPL